jgi:hypothetical protein
MMLKFAAQDDIPPQGASGAKVPDRIPLFNEQSNGSRRIAADPTALWSDASGRQFPTIY